MDLTMLTKFLAPFLPFLVNLGSQASQEAAKKLGANIASNTGEIAKRIWAQLRPRLEKHPEALETVQSLAAKPDDKDWQNKFQEQLETLLAQEPALSETLTAIISDKGDHSRIVQNVNEMSGGTVITQVNGPVNINN